MTDLSVALVSPYYPRAEPGSLEAGFLGGVEVSIDRLSRELAALGVDVSVYSTSRTECEERVDGVRHVRSRRFGTLFRNPVSALPWRLPPSADVVQVPGTYPFYSDVAVSRMRRHGVPVVLDYHFDVHPTGPLMAAATGTYYATLGRLMRNADVAFVKSLDYAGGARGLHAFPAERVRPIPNGVDVARFRARWPSSDYVLCVGRLIPYKGVDVLLHAMARVQKRHRAPLVIAGTGPLRGELERLAERLGVEARFLGYVPEDELAELYGRARLTVLPSRNGQEAFGICLLESMACGTPVLAPDLPGVRGVAREGGAVFSPPGDPEALARALDAVLSGETPLPRGPALAARIAATYGWRAVAERTLKEYRALVEEPSLCVSSV